MVGHQESRSVGYDDLYLIAFCEVTQVVRCDAEGGCAGVVLGDTLYRQRKVVVAWPFAFARARDRVQAHVMRLAGRVQSGWLNADRLALQNRKRGATEVEHDMPDVAAGVVCGQAEVSTDRGERRLLDRIDIGVRMRGRPRRKRFAALTGGGDRRNPGHLRRYLRGRSRIELGLWRQDVPCELLGKRIWLHLVHLAPAVDGSRWARGDAVVAKIALLGIHDVVARVMRDRVRWTGFLARIAADAYFRV